MSDGQVTITMSIEHAAAMLAWKQQREGVNSLTKGLSESRREYASLTAEQKKVAAGFAQLSAAGKQAFQNQTAWSAGLKEMDKQRVAQIQKVAAEANKAAAEASKSAAESAAGIREIGAELGQSVMSAALPFATISGAVATTVSGLKQAVILTKELDALRDKATMTREEAEERFKSQALTSGVSEKRLTQIAESATVQGAPYGLRGAESLDIAREAVSQGVKPEDVLEFVNVANRFAAAQGAKLDVAMFKSFVQQTRVEDEGLSPKAALDTAQAFYGAYLNRQIQPQQLEAFSRQNYGLKEAGLNAFERTAVNTASLDIYGGSAEQASTFNRALVQKLRAAKDKPEAKKALQAMGLDPTDVDFVGEGLRQVLDRLGAAVEAMPEEERVPKLFHVFGEEFSAQALAFIKNRQKVYDIQKEIEQGKPFFDVAAKRLTSTQAARQRTFEAQEENEASKHGAPVFDTVRAAMLAELEREHKGAVEKRLATMRYDVSAFFRRHFAGAQTEDDAVALAADAAAVGVEPGDRAEKFKSKLRERLASREVSVAKAPEVKRFERSAEEEARLRQIRERAAAGVQDQAQAKIDAKEAKRLAGLRTKQEGIVSRLQEVHDRIEDRGAKIRNLEEDRQLREAEQRLPHHYRGEAREALDKRREESEIRRLVEQIERERREDKEDRARQDALMEEQNALLRQIAQGQGKGGAVTVRTPAQRPQPVRGGN